MTISIISQGKAAAFDGVRTHAQQTTMITSQACEPQRHAAPFSCLVYQNLLTVNQIKKPNSTCITIYCISDDFEKYCHELETTPAWGGHLEVMCIVILDI